MPHVLARRTPRPEHQVARLQGIAQHQGLIWPDGARRICDVSPAPRLDRLGARPNASTPQRPSTDTGGPAITTTTEPRALWEIGLLHSELLMELHESGYKLANLSRDHNGNECVKVVLRYGVATITAGELSTVVVLREPWGVPILAANHFPADTSATTLVQVVGMLDDLQRAMRQ
jgi:hypothetical protein